MRTMSRAHLLRHATAIYVARWRRHCLFRAHAYQRHMRMQAQPPPHDTAERIGHRQSHQQTANSTITIWKCCSFDLYIAMRMNVSSIIFYYTFWGRVMYKEYASLRYSSRYYSNVHLVFSQFAFCTVRPPDGRWMQRPLLQPPLYVWM